MLELFKASKVGTIAGSRVTEGKITRDAEARLVRDGTVIWTGRVGSLRRFKDDVREVEQGQECGITLDGFQDVKVGDVLEVFETTAGREDPRVGRGRMAFVFLLEVRLHVADSDSLKAKRKVVRSVKDAVRERLGAAVAEIDGHDTWQRSTLLCALVGRERGRA